MLTKKYSCAIIREKLIFHIKQLSVEIEYCKRNIVLMKE